MTKNDEMKLKLLTVTAKSFSYARIDSDTIVFYVKMLTELDYPVLEAAIRKILRTAKYFPTIAEILAAADDVTAAATGTDKFDAGQAWGEAMENVRRNHVYKTWVYSHPEVEQAVNEFGGKMALIELQVDNVNTARAQFMRIYNSIIARQQNQRQNAAVLDSLGNQRVAALISNTADARKLKPA